MILKAKAKGLRKETGDTSIVAPIELQKQDLRELLVVVLTRPVRMVSSPCSPFSCEPNVLT